jgi:hypothetical protein
VNGEGIHSAVWIAPEYFADARQMLAVYGIVPAERRD